MKSGILTRTMISGKMFLVALTVVLPAALGQYYNGVKPDVRFDDRSDRFDAVPLMDMGAYEEAEYRRSMSEKQNDEVDKTLNLLRLVQSTLASKESAEDSKVAPKLAELIKAIARRSNKVQGDWGWHDGLENDGHEFEYEKNLEQFRAKLKPERRNLVNYLHNGQASRRSAPDTPDSEVLMHHAVPIMMNVKGYFEVPVVEDE